MPSEAQLCALLLAAMALNFVPSPDMLYVVAQSVGKGRRAGVASAFGIATGGMIHTLAAVAELSVVLSSSALAFAIVKYVGASYLVHLGIRIVLDRADLFAATGSPDSEHRVGVFCRGVITNVLNAKVALFFLAFLPQFVDMANGSADFQLLVLGVVFNVTGTIVNLGVAILGDGLRSWIQVHRGAANVRRSITGAVFIALAVRLALAKQD